jgi:hypothetical protein
MPITRIYADFNGLVSGPKNPERTAVALDTFASLRDLSNAGVILKEGLPLVAFDWSDDEEDLEGHGTAQFDHRRNRWVVEFDESGVRYVPAGDRRTASDFYCVNCRFELPRLADRVTFQIDIVCPSCGTAVSAAITPPYAES